jgi:carbamoyl-phosphate synthase large subunit
MAKMFHCPLGMLMNKRFTEFLPNDAHEGLRERLAQLLGVPQSTVRRWRLALGQGSTPRSVTYKRVDTCAAEFEAYTPYYYSTYGEENETKPSKKNKVMILGGGPNRIGQGIEFDYCCSHAAFALKELKIKSIVLIVILNL